jgi:hypothetical protein
MARENRVTEMKGNKMKLSELLQASKDCLIRDGWCLGKTTNDNGEHCAVGAIQQSGNENHTWPQYEALAEIIRERYHAGTLPELKFAGGMSSLPLPADKFIKRIFSEGGYESSLVIVFNNNSTEKDVFQLFNEAIDRAKAKEAEEVLEEVLEEIRD